MKEDIKFNIIVTASYIPKHPSTTMICKTIKSLSYINYQGPKKINVYLAHDFSNEMKYMEYLNKLEQYCIEYNDINKSFNLKVIIRKSHGHLVGNVRNALKYVDSEYLLIIQHDLPFCKHFIINEVLQDMEENSELKHIRFNKRKNYELGWDIDNVNYWNNYNVRGRKNYISTLCWSDNNHLTRKSYYNDIIMNKCKDGGPMERFLNEINTKQSHLGTYVFGEIGEKKYIKHLDGREGNTKKKRFIEKIKKLFRVLGIAL